MQSLCPIVFPSESQFSFFFWSRQSAKVSSPNTFRFGLKRGGHAWDPCLVHFIHVHFLLYNLYIYFTFQGTKPKFFGLSSQRLMLFQTGFLCLRDFHCIVYLVSSPKRTGHFSPSSHSCIISLSAILCSLPHTILLEAVIGQIKHLESFSVFYLFLLLYWMLHSKATSLQMCV